MPAKSLRAKAKTALHLRLPKYETNMKSKVTAALLAFFLGIFGVHRFYLGQRFLGVLYFMAFTIGFIIMTDNGTGAPPFIIIPALIGFIDSVLLAVMPQEDFDERYNRKRLRQQARTRQHYEPRPVIADQRSTLGEVKKRGIEKFRDYDFEGAIEDFLKALEMQPADAATHFNLACSYALLEQKNEAFRHLQAAVDYGFKQFDKIDTHDALAFLRAQPEFDAFVQNGYRLTTEIPAETAPPAPEETPLVLQDDLLDQIIKLGELRDKGILTEDEFAAQKQKILAQR